MECIIVHGGAWNIPQESHEDHIKGCKKATDIGFDCIEDATEAVVEAVAYMEDDVTFDAGVGSFLNEDGDVEMDAIVYRPNCFGSVCSVKHVRNPVRLARKLCDEQDFSMLSGTGAETYAREQNIPLVSNNFFKVEREILRWDKLRRQKNFRPSDAFKFSTVGAVALDRHGVIAVALSTGGTPLKKRGRIGDTPVPGAGAYASKIAGVASTGYGESILKFLLARQVCVNCDESDAMTAARQGIEKMSTTVGGYGGVICLNVKGMYGYAHNTPYMAVAYKDKNTSFAKI